MNIERAFRKAELANSLRVVNDGDAAVDYLDGQPPYEDRDQNPTPTLVLLDLKLPRRSGLEVLEWIRGNQRLKRRGRGRKRWRGARRDFHRPAARRAPAACRTTGRRPSRSGTRRDPQRP
jgi:CheY-like chemotaxis protein